MTLQVARNMTRAPEMTIAVSRYANETLPPRVQPRL